MQISKTEYNFYPCHVAFTFLWKHGMHRCFDSHLRENEEFYIFFFKILYVNDAEMHGVMVQQNSSA